MSRERRMNLAGAAITAALGVLGLLKPRVASDIIGLDPRGKLGLSELRAAYGGIFFSLGAGTLLHRDERAFGTLGLVWLGAATGRALSVVVDRSVSPQNLFALVFEVAVVGLLFAGDGEDDRR